MFSKEMKNAAEQALFESNKAFMALRAVGFMLDQTQGGGPFAWTEAPLQDLGTLLGVIADHGYQVSDEALENLQGAKPKTDEAA